MWIPLDVLTLYSAAHVMSGPVGNAKSAAAIGRSPAYEITMLVESLQRAFPVPNDYSFATMLREIDAAEEANNERPK